MPFIDAEGKELPIETDPSVRIGKLEQALAAGYKELDNMGIKLNELTGQLARSESACKQALRKAMDEREMYLALHARHKMLCRILHDLAQHGYEVEKSSPIPPTFDYNTSP